MGEDNYSVRRLYPPTGDPPVKPGIRLMHDPQRRTAFTFTVGAERRTFYHFTREQALEDARLWALAHGRQEVVDE